MFSPLKKFTFKIVIFIFSLTPMQGIFAQTVSLPKETERYDAVVLSNTQIHRIHSRFTNVDYKIYISLPASYFDRKQDKKYPVLYLLDADYSFALAKQMGDFFMDRNMIKDIIIVGIAYDGPLKYKLNRTRDYTPSHVMDGGVGYGPEYQKYSGGADRFYQFIKEELIPSINRKFPTSNENTLVGHSYGGLFASYGLLNYPEIFHNAIIVSPSLWYDHKKVLRQAQTKKDFNFDSPHKIYFSVGEKENIQDYEMVDDLNDFCADISKKPHHNIVYKTDVIAELNHNTIFPAALTKGMIYIFAD